MTVAMGDADRADPSRPTKAPDDGAKRVLVWDRAVRVFHWLLVAGVAVAWYTSGSGHRVHEFAGSVVAGLIGFRLIWGLIGSPHARFRDFVVGPRRAIGYVGRFAVGRAQRYIGHNPAGGYMILAMLATLVVLVVTGSLHLTNRFYGVEWVEVVHHQSANLLLALISLHVLGALISSLMHKENLIAAMITGGKPAIIDGHPAARPEPPPSEATTGAFRERSTAGLCLLASGVIIGLAYAHVNTAHRATSAVEMVAAVPSMAFEPALTIAKAEAVPGAVRHMADAALAPIGNRAISEGPPTPERAPPIAPLTPDIGTTLQEAKIVALASSSNLTRNRVVTRQAQRKTDNGTRSGLTGGKSNYR